jgi:uncharacterized protein with PQ loop repeat
LKATDFVGICQYPLIAAMSRMLTFMNAAALWLMYLPSAMLNMVFFDKEPRSVRDAKKIYRDAYFNRVLSILNPLIGIVITIVLFVGFLVHGVGSVYVVTMSKFLGTFACFLCMAQYLPQIITTCKLRDHGSLSLLVLALQAPGGFVNSMFMWLGQGDDWTTWVSTMASAIQQVILLTICMFFKCRKKRRMRLDENSATAPILDEREFDVA